MATASALFEKYPDLLTTDDVAEILSVPRSTAQALCREHKLPNVKIGRRVYVPKVRLIEDFGLDKLAGEGVPDAVRR